MNKIFLLMCLVTSAFGSIERRSLNIKLPTQGVLEQQVITAPGASSATAILNANAGPSSAAAVTVSSFAGQPDVPRNIVIQAGGTASSINAACVVTVVGTDIKNQSITENFIFGAAQATPSNGAKAFKTVTSVSWAAGCESSAFSTTWNVGYGTKLGLLNCMKNAGHFFHANLNGVKETTAPTVVAGSSIVSNNTIQLNSTLNSTDVEALYVQNFQCNP